MCHILLLTILEKKADNLLWMWLEMHLWNCESWEMLSPQLFLSKSFPLPFASWISLMPIISHPPTAQMFYIFDTIFSSGLHQGRGVFIIYQRGRGDIFLFIVSFHIFVIFNYSPNHSVRDMAVQQLVNFSSSTLENLPNYRIIAWFVSLFSQAISGIFPYVSFFSFF